MTAFEVRKMATENLIYGINGPVVTIKGKTDLSMLEMVYVGEARLAGEVIGIENDTTTIQVYEETDGLCPGEKVYSTGSQMCVTLGPGIISNIFDGIERPRGRHIRLLLRSLFPADDQLVVRKILCLFVLIVLGHTFLPSPGSSRNPIISI